MLLADLLDLGDHLADRARAHAQQLLGEHERGDLEEDLREADAPGVRVVAEQDPVAAVAAAGGQMALGAACTAHDAHFQPGFESADTSVAAAIAFYGYYGWPLPPFPPDAPPLFVLHGDLDTVVPVEDARAFVAKAQRESKNPVLYAELPGAHHNFDLFHSIRSEAVIDGVKAFTTWVLANRERIPTGTAPLKSVSFL